jgi:MFS family permease
MGVARRLALGRLISLAGGSAAYIALVAAIYGRTGSALWVSAAIFAGLIAREATLRRVVVAGVISLFAIGIVGVASYPLSVDLGAGARGYGAMTALLGGGGVVGAALAARLLRLDPGRVLAWSFLASGVGLALAGAVPALAPALAGMALSGAGRGLADVAQTTMIQQHAIDEARSRVFAAQEGAAHIAYSVSAIAGGLLTELAGVRGAFAAAAAFAVAAAAVVRR